MKVSNEFKIGVTVVAGIAVLFIGINYLKGYNIFEKQTKIHSVYGEVNGLVESNPVTLNGYKVGKVKKIQIQKNDPDRITVTMVLLEQGLKIPVDSKAEIYSSDLLGSKAVRILLGERSEYVAAADTLEGKTEASIKAAVSEQVKPIKRKADRLLKSVDSAVRIVRVILNEDARRNLKSSFNSIQKSFQVLETTSRRLDTLVKEERIAVSRVTGNLESITKNIRGKNAELSNTVDNLSNISDSLANADLTATVNNAKDVMADLSRVSRKIESGKGSMGRLINDDTLHNELVRASDQLETLLEDMRVNPQRYVHFSVFGRKEKSQRLSKEDLDRVQKFLKEKRDSIEKNADQ